MFVRFLNILCISLYAVCVDNIYYVLSVIDLSVCETGELVILGTVKSVYCTYT